MKPLRPLFALFLVAALPAAAAPLNVILRHPHLFETSRTGTFDVAATAHSILWRHDTGLMSADVRGLSLLPMLRAIAAQSDWTIYVEPGSERVASAKFADEPPAAALRMLLGDLNFTIVTSANGATSLYVFKSVRQNATQLVVAPPRHVPDELIVRLKPGADINALARMLGAKVVGRLDGLGLYRLQFSDAAAAELALSELQQDQDVLSVGYNNYFNPPPAVQNLGSSTPPLGPVNLQLRAPSGSGKVIVGLIDTAVQSSDTSLDQFLLKQISVADGTQAGSSELTHGTAMAQTILRAIDAVEHGNSSVQVLPVDVYGSSPDTTTWNVAQGIMAAVANGANVINLSLGDSTPDPMLADVIQAVENDHIPIFAAAGNQSTASATYPAAYPGVMAVTALERGAIAPYADFGSFVDFAAPDGAIAYLNGQPWFTMGTSVSTANMTGLAAGLADSTHQPWPQITSTLYQWYPVPK
ncbi:MAG: S8 family serine peptidase [Verrucomicrobiota bacterium]|nr:S8 family serine peptidase [Verrucomicrobiota bacterium]